MDYMGCHESQRLYAYEKSLYEEELHKERLAEVSEQWLDDKIKLVDLDELWCAVGEDITKVLWEAGVSGKPFTDEVRRRILEDYREDLETYVEASVNLETYDGF